MQKEEALLVQVMDLFALGLPGSAGPQNGGME